MERVGANEHPKVKNMKNIELTEDFIYDLVVGKRLEKANRNATLNREKLSNCGLEHGRKYNIGDNIYVAFFPKRNSLGKTFYWGSRVIKKETAQKRIGL